MQRVALMLAVAGLLLGGVGQAGAVPINVYLLSTGNSAEDAAVQSVLTAHGDNVTIGPNYQSFTGPVPSGFNTVLLLPNNSGIGGNVPTSGQTALLNFVNGGGGLVTSEWLVWGMAAENFNQTLKAAMPVIPSSAFDYNSPLTYNQVTPNAVLNNGVSSSFTFTADNNGGTETYFQPQPGATVYYSTTGSSWVGGDGVIGGNYGSGKVISFSTLAGPTELSNPEYAQLFSNAVALAGGQGFVATPEPSTLTLAGLLSLGLVGAGWRRRKQAPPDRAAEE